jgi:hypothetical protein
MDNIKNNNQLKKCPWCRKFNFTPCPEKEDTVLVYNCSRCDKPVILFEEKTYRMDEKISLKDDSSKVEDFIVTFLEKFGIDMFEDLQEKLNSSDKYKKKITKQEIQEMRSFLDDYKVPLQGDFL